MYSSYYVNCSFYDLEELINVRALLNHLLSLYQNMFCGETLLNIEFQLNLVKFKFKLIWDIHMMIFKDSFALIELFVS